MALVTALLAFAPAATAQDTAQPAPNSDPQNIQAYIDSPPRRCPAAESRDDGCGDAAKCRRCSKILAYLRRVRQELAKLNDLRVANIQEYASTYDQMTDEKADELIQKALSYRKQRSELLAKYYERVRQALGGVTAARFIQVEDQLLLIIDLQIDSSLADSWARLVTSEKRRLKCAME